MEHHIETDRLLIRKINPDDLASLLMIYNSSTNMQYISTGKHQWSMNELVNKYEQLNQGYIHRFGIYVVEVKATHQVIGEAGFFDSFNRLDHLELGYIIDCSFWNIGYGSEICKALINYGFKTLKLRTITARMYANNVASVKLSERCGMTRIQTGTTAQNQVFHEYRIELSDWR